MPKKAKKKVTRPSRDGGQRVQRTFWIPESWVDETEADLLIELPDGSRESLTAFARAAWKNEMARRKHRG